MARKTTVVDGKLVVEEGSLFFSVDLFRLMEGLDADAARQMAEAITWDSVLDEAVRRLTGKGENSSSADERLTVGVLSEMEYRLAGRSWAVLSDILDVGRQIRSRERLWAVLAQLRNVAYPDEGRNEPQREALRGCVDAFEKELRRPMYLEKDESLGAFQRAMEEKLKEAFPEGHHAELEAESFIRIHEKLRELLGEVMVRLGEASIVGSWNRESADRSLAGLSFEGARGMEEEFRRLLGLHPEALEKVTIEGQEKGG